jgi:hypothetical protein
MSDFVSGVSDWMLQQGGFMATWAPWDYGSAKPGYTLPAGVNETTLINLWRRGGTDAPDAWKAFWGYGPAATAGSTTGAPPTTGALPAGTDATATTAAPGGPGQVLAAADGTLAPAALAGLSPGVIALLALILLLVIFMLVRRWRAQH